MKDREMNKICLNMIVKNEGSIIHQTLSNIMKYFKIDYYVISDTGSTDNTIEVITNFFDSHKINGEIYEDEWVDFSFNRNLVYSRCEGKTEYVLFVDADDSFKGRLILPDMFEEDVYMSPVRHGETSLFISRPVLVKWNPSFKWKGILYEYFDFPKSCSVKKLSGEDFYLLSGKFGSRHHENTLRNDLEVLKKAFETPDYEDLKSHYAYSCGKLYFTLKDIKKSEYWLKEALKYPSFGLEHLDVYNYLGKLYEEKRDYEKAIKNYLSGFNKYPEYIENPYKAINLLRRLRRFEEAYNLALSSRFIEVPSNSTYIGDISVYESKYPYELFLLSSLFNNFNVVFSSIIKILKSKYTSYATKIKVLELFLEFLPEVKNLSSKESNILLQLIENIKFKGKGNLTKQLEENSLLKPKKILFLHPFMMVGGVETILKDYTSHLISEGIKVDIVFAEYAQEKYYADFNENIHIHKLLNKFEGQFFIRSHVKAIDSKESEENLSYYKSWYQGLRKEISLRLLKIIEKGHYDLVIDFKDSLFSHFPYAIDSLSLPVYYWIHSNDYFERWNKYKDTYKKILSKTSKIISICNDMEKIALKELEKMGIMDFTLETIYNPIDINRIETLSKKYSIFDFQDEKNISPYLVCVSRLEDKQKNISGLIKSYKKMREKGLTEKLIILGDGPSKETLENLIKELELQENCFLIGSLENPYPFIKEAKMLLLTSKYEGFPTVLLESLACRTPVISFDCPTGPREILEDGRYGILIKQDDYDNFEDKIIEEKMKGYPFDEDFFYSLKRFSMRDSINKIKNKI